MIDYQEIINNLTDDNIKQILDKLNIPYQDKGSYLLMPTYCHNHKSEDASLKLYYYKNNKVFMCYTECGGMNIFTFLRHYYEAQEIDYDWYSDIYYLITETSNYSSAEITINKYKSIKDRYDKIERNFKFNIFSNACLDCFIKKYPVEWLEDNISIEAMDKFNILYSISQNKIIIPHYDIEGNLIGIRGRALNKWDIENLGKYMPVQIEGKWYNHPLGMNLYGLNFNKENIKKEGICFVYEGEKSVLQLETFNRPNCSVAVCGSQFNKYQLNLLLKNCNPKEIVICFDKEELKYQDKYFNKLWNMCSKYKNYCDISFIYDRQNLLSMKESPSDEGEEIFNKLLEKRVQVQ